MDRELSRDELDELLPIFALDALDEGERVQVERYVERDSVARAEVDSFREMLAMLAYPGQAAPESLRRGLEEAVGASMAAPVPMPAMPLLGPTSGQRRKGGRVRRQGRSGGHVRTVASALVGAAAIAVIAALSVAVLRQQTRIDELASQMPMSLDVQAEVAAASPTADRIVLMTDDKTRGAEIVMLPDGSGYFMHDDLPRLSKGKTYQLWAKTGTRRKYAMVSLGVLGADPKLSAFKVTAPVMGFVVTEEKRTGAGKPSSPLLASDVT